MSLFFPNWLQERIIALVEKTIDPQVAALQNRVDKLERQEKVASERIDAMDTAITELRERFDTFAEHVANIENRISEEQDAQDKALSNLGDRIEAVKADADAKIGPGITEVEAALIQKLNEKVGTALTEIQRRYESQPIAGDIAPKNTIEKRSGSGVKLHKRTS